MKRVINLVVIILVIFILAGCSNKSNNKKLWPTTDVIEYSKGNIVAVQNEESKYNIKIDETTEDDYNNYVEALKTTTFEYINIYDDDNIWTGTNNTKYVYIKYIDSSSSNYEGYNIEIIIYSQKPQTWNK